MRNLLHHHCISTIFHSYLIHHESPVISHWIHWYPLISIQVFNGDIRGFYGYQWIQWDINIQEISMDIRIPATYPARYPSHHHLARSSSSFPTWPLSTSLPTWRPAARRGRNPPRWKGWTVALRNLHRIFCCHGSFRECMSDKSGWIVFFFPRQLSNGFQSVLRTNRRPVGTTEVVATMIDEPDGWWSNLVIILQYQWNWWMAHMILAYLIHCQRLNSQWFSAKLVPDSTVQHPSKKHPKETHLASNLSIWQRCFLRTPQNSCNLNPNLWVPCQIFVFSSSLDWSSAFGGGPYILWCLKTDVQSF